MTDPKPAPDTAASPDPAPTQPHGDAFLDQSGSRHGTPPEERPDEEAEGGEDQDA